MGGHSPVSSADVTDAISEISVLAAALPDAVHRCSQRSCLNSSCGDRGSEILPADDIPQTAVSQCALHAATLETHVLMKSIENTTAGRERPNSDTCSLWLSLDRFRRQPIRPVRVLSYPIDEVRAHITSLQKKTGESAHAWSRSKPARRYPSASLRRPMTKLASTRSRSEFST